MEESIEEPGLVREDSFEDVPTLCLLGSTGTGKSSTCNTLLGCRGNNVFRVSHDTASLTSQPEVKVLPWRGNGPLVRCVDLPGLGSSRGHDGDRIADTVATLRQEVRHVHAFLIVINGQVPRFDAHLQRTLVALKGMLGEGFLENAMIGFTHWDFARSAQRRRERSGRTEAWKATLVNKELRKLLGHSFDCPCFFIDNALHALSDTELEEEFGESGPEVMREFEAELGKVYTFARGKEPFHCMDLGAAPSEQACPPPGLLVSPLPAWKSSPLLLAKGLADGEGGATDHCQPAQRNWLLGALQSVSVDLNGCLYDW